MEIYTREQWTKDREFSAKVGQEVTEEIYEDFFDMLPPLRLPRESGYTAGFRISEPYIHEESKKTGEWLAHYAAFGKKDGKYYFLGHMNKYGELCSRDKEGEAV